MTSDDAEYYRGRVAVERDLARHAANPYARRAHQELADNYEILCRLLCAKPPRPVSAQPTIDSIGFTMLFQTLATPRSANLVQVHGSSSRNALRQPFRRTELDHRVAAETDAQAAINERSSAPPISPASTAA